MLSGVRIPDEKPWDNSGARSQRERCDGGSCGGRYPEKIYKDAFVPRCVLIDEDSDGFVVAQGSQDIPGSISLVDRGVTGKPAISFDQPFHFAIVDLSHDKLHWIAVEGMCKAAEFP